MARSNRDIYWKGILEDLFADFLHFFYPNADKLFDIYRGFEFLDQECEKLFPINDPEHPKSVDKLVTVFTREGKEEWILLHIEVQGYKGRKDFSERMFTCFYHIRDSYNKPVRSLAIFTDSNSRFHPKEYVHFDTPEINAKFDSEIDHLNNKTRTMGIIEQVAQVRAEEAVEKNKTDFVRNLLQENIFTVEKIAQLAEVSVDFVQQIKKHLNLK